MDRKVVTLKAKVTTSAYNHKEAYNHAQAFDNPNNYNNEVWLTVKEGYNLLNITQQALAKQIKSGKIRAKQVRGNGGMQYRIALSSLPAEVQVRYWGVAEAPKPSVFNGEVLPDEDIEADLRIYQQSPTWARVKADKYLNLINMTAHLRGLKLRAFIDEWNKNNPTYNTSYPRLMAAKKDYERDGINALIAKYGNRAGDTTVSDQYFEIFRSSYLKQGSTSVRACWLSALGQARIDDSTFDVASFPSPAAFARRLKRTMTEEAIYMARHGEAKHNKVYNNFINRDYKNIRVNEIWVSDHAQIDVMVSYKDEQGRERYGAPWCTVWRDFKSGKWLGYILYVGNPNSDRIFEAFYAAASVYGLPDTVIIDNGKDYRSKDFAGGRTKKVKVEVNENQARSMLGLLKVNAHFALPYNAQTKPVERDFLSTKHALSKMMTGYRGGNVTERPEILKKEIDGKLIQIDAFNYIFHEFIEKVLNVVPNGGKNHKGRSRDEVWNADFTEIKMVSPDALALFCARISAEFTIKRNGIRDNKLDDWYYGEWMAGYKGHKVYMRRDNTKYQEAWVFCAETDKFLGKAQLGMLTAPAFAKTDIEKTQLAKVTAIKKQSIKITKSYLQDIQKPDPKEQILRMAAGAEALGGQKNNNNNKQIIKLAQTPMDDAISRSREIERYNSADSNLPAAPAPKVVKIKAWASDE